MTNDSTAEKAPACIPGEHGHYWHDEKSDEDHIVPCSLASEVESLRDQVALWSDTANHQSSKLAEAQATIANALAQTKRGNMATPPWVIEALSAPSSTGGNALADVKAQAVHEAAEAIRHHCTAPGEPLNADPLIAFVADWIENPPEWVEVSYRKGNDHEL